MEKFIYYDNKATYKENRFGIHGHIHTPCSSFSNAQIIAKQVKMAYPEDTVIIKNINNLTSEEKWSTLVLYAEK